MAAPCSGCQSVETPRGGRCGDCRRVRKRDQRRTLALSRAWLREFTASGARERLWGPVSAQSWRCLACGRRFGPELPPELSLAVPLSRGGSNETANCTALCRDCHVEQDGRTFDEWVTAGGRFWLDWRAVTAATVERERLWSARVATDCT